MGNAVLTCGADEFERFRGTVKRSCHHVGLSTRDDDETHLISWNSPSMGFAFTKGELFELRFLVEGAAAMLRRHPGVEDALTSET